MRKIDDDHNMMLKPDEPALESQSPIPKFVKSSSQANLNVLSSSSKMSSSRGTVFNSAARDMITQSTSDLMKYKESMDIDPVPVTYRETKKLNFDEYLAQFERDKVAERNKSPAEHRSKYFNDVFNSSVNLGNQNKKETKNVNKIIMEIEARANENSENKRYSYPTPMSQFQQQQMKESYIPTITNSYAKRVEQDELFKPKNRYKHWKPIMRDLEPSYDVHDYPTPAIMVEKPVSIFSF